MTILIIVNMYNNEIDLEKEKSRQIYNKACQYKFDYDVTLLASEYIVEIGMNYTKCLAFITKDSNCIISDSARMMIDDSHLKSDSYPIKYREKTDSIFKKYNSMIIQK